MYDDIGESEWSAAHARQLHALFQKEWWTAARSLDEVDDMLRLATHRYAIRHVASDHLVAFARVVTDGIFKALIFDVIVDDAHRGEALGHRLMKRIETDPTLSRVAHLELYCLPELQPFYERHGFTRDIGGVGLMRRDHRA